MRHLYYNNFLNQFIMVTIIITMLLFMVIGVIDTIFFISDRFEILNKQDKELSILLNQIGELNGRITGLENKK